MITDEERSEICDNCQNKNTNDEDKAICGITGLQPSFEEECPYYFAKNDQQQAEIEDDIVLEPASVGKRIINYILDMTFIFVFSYIALRLLSSIALNIHAVMNLFIWLSDLGTFGNYLISFMMILIYYTLFESIFGFSPAKIFTSTNVVTSDGEKPTFLNILGRTLCRFIPFDQLSFLKAKPIGWHDGFSNTAVIEDYKKKRILIPGLLLGAILLCSGIFWLKDSSLLQNPGHSNDSGYKLVSYHDISFQCKNNWKIEKSENVQDKSYQINCQSPDINSGINLSLGFVKGEINLEEWLKLIINSLKETSVFKNASFEEISSTNFNLAKAFSVKFKTTLFESDYYGKIIVFHEKNISVCYFKQAKTAEDLDNAFSLIEASLKLK